MDYILIGAGVSLIAHIAILRRYNRAITDPRILISVILGMAATSIIVKYGFLGMTIYFGILSAITNIIADEVNNTPGHNMESSTRWLENRVACFQDAFMRTTILSLLVLNEF